jgi:hypothetical protein
MGAFLHIIMFRIAKKSRSAADLQIAGEINLHAGIIALATVDMDRENRIIREGTSQPGPAG